MTPIQGPDFICIGMPKAGTRWLYDQLDHHPDFWMPPVKELHYLHKASPKLENTLELLGRWDAVARRAEKKGFGPQERERGFLEELSSLARQPRDIGRYANLFRHKGDLLSGDISPGYCSIEDDDVIGEIAAGLPRTRIVLLVREPIARVWSRICMSEREGNFDVSLLDDPEKFTLFLARKRYVRGRSMPTEILRRWSSFFPEDRFRVILFDEIAHKPAATFAEILRFVGADASKPGSLPADHNRKSQLRKIQMPDCIKQVLVDHFADEIRACARLLGDAAGSWPSLYGL
jgi:hypothetical protein